MAKRYLQKIDLVPEWLREVIATDGAEQAGMPAPKNPSTKHEFSIIDPKAPGEAQVRQMQASLYEDPRTGKGVVQLAWSGTTPPLYEFEKEYPNRADASVAFGKMLEELRGIEKISDPAIAKEKVAELFDEYKKKTDSPRTGHSEKVVNTSLADGWNIIEKEGKLVVDFSDDFLMGVLADHKVADSMPIQPAEYTYSTASRLHCGSDNFVISYWRKTQTSDGNIVRNATLISRVGGGSQLVTGMPLTTYNLLCAALTPNPKHYDISYDSVTGKWHKTANAATFLTSTPEELQMVLEYLGKGKKPPKSEEALPELEPEKKGKEEKEPKAGEESLPIGGEGTTPIGEGGMEAAGEGSPEEQLMDLLKKESDKK